MMADVLGVAAIAVASLLPSVLIIIGCEHVDRQYRRQR